MKKSKRSRTKYPGLDKKVNLKIRQDSMDQDYINQLTDEEKQWLSNFNEEYNGANFNHPGKKLHKTKKQKRDCYNRNNARNRDAYSITKSNDMLKDETDIINEIELQRSTNHNEIEDHLIEMIDLSDKINKG